MFVVLLLLQSIIVTTPHLSSPTLLAVLFALPAASTVWVSPVRWLVRTIDCRKRPCSRRLARKVVQEILI